MNAEILQPIASLVAWSMVIWVWLYATRIPAMQRANIDAKNMIGGSGADLKAVLPPTVQWKADNYNHLMEQPTVFYAAAFTLALLGMGNGFNASLAWVYVGFRIIHSLVQVLVNRVIIRFALHFLGTIPLIMLATRALFAAFGFHTFGVAH